MVVDHSARKMNTASELEAHISESPIKWCSVSLSNMISRGKRLEASVFDIEAKQARETVMNGKYKSLPLIGEHSPVRCAYYGGRLKRNYVSKEHKNAIGFIGSSEMLDIMPQPAKFMVDSPHINDLRVFYGMILLSRSGTIGNLAFVNKTLSKLLVSEHAIRLECREYPGYVYAFLKSKVGQLLIKSNTFGAVISEIEPTHIATVPIPDASIELKQKIHNLIIDSFDLRDESNELIDKATTLLVEELQLPNVSTFNASQHKLEVSVDTFNLKLSDVEGRLDASYHIPIANAIIEHLQKYAKEVTTIGDVRISSDVVLPGRFKRIYVDEEHGVKFLGGKVMQQLNPTSEKYLSKQAHKKQLEGALGIKDHSILTPARGSLGEVVLPCKQFLDWAISDNMIQILSYEDICGYVYIFLHSEYGRALIKRFTYGGVVDAIEPEHIKQVEIPILKNHHAQEQINALALEANVKRYEAYQLEQEAIRIINEEVIFAK